MKSFLLKNNKPIIYWSMLKDGTMFSGLIPENFDLAVCPTYGYIIVDVDNKNGKNGSANIPKELIDEFDSTFYYKTKSGGFHYWFKYTGNEILPNTTSKLSIDLRVGANGDNNGGYVKWHPRNEYSPIWAEEKANRTSRELNNWLERTFYYKNKK